MSRLTSKQIGAIIQQLRKKHSLTGVELARQAGMSQSKLSKIETGFMQHPDPANVKQLLNILSAPKSILQQVTTALDTAEPRMKAYSYFPTEAQRLEMEARDIRIYVANSLPALLQGIAFRKAFLTCNDVAESEQSTDIKQLVSRQDAMWNGNRKYHFIFPQMALYTKVGSPKIQYAQLDRIERLMEARDISIGILAVESGALPMDYGSFAVYDDHLALSAVAQGEIVYRQDHDIYLYSNIFAQLASLACYDDEARALIRAAMKHFS